MNLNNIKKWDKVVFKNGKVFMIQKLLDGSRAVLSNGEEIDFLIDGERIKEIIPFREYQKEPLYDKKEEQAIEDSCNKKPLKKHITTYAELRSLLTHGEEFLGFYHLTAVENAIQIINDGYLGARETAKNIIYDNVVYNLTSKGVKGSNRSTRILKYVRFYMNIINKATFSMKYNFKNNGTYGVIFAIPFETIKELDTPIILSPINAHYLTDEDFDWRLYNIHNEKKLANIDFSEFNFKKTYSAYNDKVENEYLTAEVLFYDKVPLEYIKHIIFKNSQEMYNFLDHLPYNKRRFVENKCKIIEDLFKLNYDKDSR